MAPRTPTYARLQIRAHWDVRHRPQLVNAPDKQRQDVYGAGQAARVLLTNTGALEWIAAGRAPGREQFDAGAFAGAAGTLLLVSHKGRGSVSALTTASTAAACEEPQAPA